MNDKNRTRPNSLLALLLFTFLLLFSSLLIRPGGLLEAIGVVVATIVHHHMHTHTHTLSEVSRPPRPLLMIMFAAAYPWLSRVHSISCLCLTRRPCRPQSFLKCFSIFHANYCKQMCACKHTGAEAACYSCYFHGSEYTMINVVDLVG